MQNLPSKLFVTVSVIGIIDAAYTAYEYATGSFSGVCSVSREINCIDVFRSGHTSIFGIPFYVFGLIWFPLLLILGLALTDRTKLPLRSDILLPILLVGNIFTIYLWYLELDVIGAICPLCVSLYVLNYALTGLAIYELLS
ncbi:MAG: vitamin K epoxide reductase family protein [Thaumarchaeota archaeon]|nr:vitamin K epoxide reductase family protein [Nitrososphaerota archaeon]